jgi:hypothetical protein
MRFFSLVALIASLMGSVNAALDPPSHISPLFDIQPGTIDEGGCDAYHSNITDYYTEAIYILKAGRIAINNVMRTNYPIPAMYLPTWIRNSRNALMHFTFWFNANSGMVDPPGFRWGGWAELETVDSE